MSTEGFANLVKFSKILGRWNDPFLIRSRHTQHPFSINVWAGILGHTVHNVIEEYRENLPVETFANMWYMQDKASPCIHHDIFNYLNNEYGNNWIGRNGPRTQIALSFKTSFLKTALTYGSEFWIP
jgi:hypothetical protein